MKRRLLASILAFVIVLGLLPTAALATGENAGSETVVEQGCVPSGVKKNDDGSYQPIDSTIQYKPYSDILV